MKKTALVTGASRGIGRAIAVQLAKDGFRILLHCAENLSAAQQVMDEIEAMGGEASLLQADLCDPEQARKLGQAAAKADVLVLNASVQIRKKWQEITVEDCHRQINCNFISSMLLIQSAVPYMQQQAWGRIVTIGSVQERKPTRIC